GLYAIFAHSYPTRVRASGTGFSIGIGRGGAMISPVVAGYMFEAGASTPLVAIVMASGSILAILSLLFLRLQDGDRQRTA
ncbi:MAG: hypothetical protein RLN69_05775, partial [Woeseiaceae bacterium]